MRWPNVNCELVARNKFSRYATAEAMADWNNRLAAEVFLAGGERAQKHAFLRNEPEFLIWKIGYIFLIYGMLCRNYRKTNSGSFFTGNGTGRPSIDQVARSESRRT